MSRHEEIQRVAYRLWQERGCPIGTPEADWFRAEQKLNERQLPREGEPVPVATAKTIGSALGTLAGALDTVVASSHHRRVKPR